jgi:hypothetical protein
MLGVVIGTVVFGIGLILVGMSGSRARSRGWVGPAGAALTTLGILTLVASAIISG